MENPITYNAPLVFAFANTQVRVHRPILTDAEREKRLERIKKAAAHLLNETEKAKQNKNNIGGNHEQHHH